MSESCGLSFHPLLWFFFFFLRWSYHAGSPANACNHQTSLCSFLFKLFTVYSPTHSWRVISLISPNILAPSCRQQHIFASPKQTARSHVSSLVGTALNASWRQLLISHTYLPTCHFNAFVYVVSGLLERAWRGGGAGWRHSSSVRSSKQIELKAVLSGAAELLWWYVSDSARSWAWVSYGCQGVLGFPCNSSFLGCGGPSVTVDHLPVQPWIWSTRCWALGVPDPSPSIVHFHDFLYLMFQ